MIFELGEAEYQSQQSMRGLSRKGNRDRIGEQFNPMDKLDYVLDLHVLYPWLMCSCCVLLVPKVGQRPICFIYISVLVHNAALLLLPV